jgi:miniconductance mechanosensitive channel
MTYETIRHKLTGISTGMGIPDGIAAHTTDILLLTALLLFAIFSHLIFRRGGLIIVKIFAEKSPTRWDDILNENRFFSRIAGLVPAIIVYTLAPLVIVDMPLLTSFVLSMAQIYAILMLTLAAFSFIDSINVIYKSTKLSAKFAIKGALQALKLFSSIVCVLFILSAITDRTPLYFLSGLGALTAILLLVFKDTIMGLVAGIQLSVNDMVNEGDWIEMPQFGADGEVTDVSLTTVKVSNWDKTITTIPTYALISQSFKNWRGMEESGGRRIKRSIVIDMNSVRFCDEELISRLSKVQLISDYIRERTGEIEAYNKEKGITDESLVNGRHMTNLGTFRRYIEEYLRNHSNVHKDMTFLVRHLRPTDKGLPIEIYVFSSEQRWAHYEAIQADIFDHLLATIGEFDLRVFQSPTGADLEKLSKQA